MPGNRILFRSAAALALAGALASAACGSSASSTASQTIPVPRTLDVYSSLPLRGPLWRSGQATLAGIELAIRLLPHELDGPWRIHLQPLDDSAPVTGQPDPSQAATNARAANQDPRAVFYIGDLTAETTRVAIPILNSAGIPQVSPSPSAAPLSTVTGLSFGTQYPTGVRTFLSLVPPDSLQAAADLMMMQQAGCTVVRLAHNHSGADLAGQIEAVKGAYSLNFGPKGTENTDIGQSAFDPAQYTAGLRAIRDTGARCFFFAGTGSPAAVALADALHARPRPWRVFGGDDVCTPTFTSGPDGISPAVAATFQCTSPVPDLTASAAGRAFLKAYHQYLGPGAPAPQAALGYEAMELGLAAITRLGSQADSRQALRGQLFATKRSSLLGMYAFSPTGASRLGSYYVYGVGPDGNLQFVRALAPAGGG